VRGFEPPQALSHCLLRAARLTAPAHPHINDKFYVYKNLCKFVLRSGKTSLTEQL
jgi:hypothetical protein